MIYSCATAVDPTGMALAALALIGLAGVPTLMLAPRAGLRLAAVLTIGGSLAGLVGAGRVLTGSRASLFELAWPFPFGPALLSLDPLSALFLVPLLLAAACCSLYAVGYLSSAAPSLIRRVVLLSGVLPGSMGLVLMARDGVLLLMAWELMAVSSWLLLMTERHDPQVQRAGMVYLLVTHTATMVLFVLFGLMRGQQGSFGLPAAHSLHPDGGMACVMLVAALVGFGAKAGIMPLHIWLPGAHANAPSHISALMSGIMLKVGVYGIIRTASLFAELPVWFGWLVLLTGGVSAVTGIALAVAQHDLKRLLACSSIENIGIVCIGLGMALVGMQSGDPLMTVLGLTGAFLHMLNHALFKPLLFLGSGAVIHVAGTRRIDRMGGLAKNMPVTSLLFLTGSLAICGLPPLNGFVGELFLYVAAFHDGMTNTLPLVAFVAPLLSLVGGVAMIAFVKLYGTVFLGAFRSPGVSCGHEASWPMLLPMALLAGFCLAAGLYAPALLGLVAPVVGEYAGLTIPAVMQVAAVVPLREVSLVNGLLLAIGCAGWCIWRVLVRRGAVTVAPTWGCGYPAPTVRMQYSGSSFGDLAAGMLGSAPAVIGPGIVWQRLMVAPSRFATGSAELILDRLVLPFLDGADWCFSWLRRLQSGHMHLYLLYIFITLLLLMAWSRP